MDEEYWLGQAREKTIKSSFCSSCKAFVIVGHLWNQGLFGWNYPLQWDEGGRGW